jgi:hypothetical protein
MMQQVYYERDQAKHAAGGDHSAAADHGGGGDHAPAAAPAGEKH